LVKDDEWFFDTELLVTAERLHMRLSEVPVDWVDDPDSRVSIVPTAIKDLRGIWRISHGRAARVARGENDEAALSDRQVTADQLLPFAGVGVISTLGFLLLFLAWRPVVGTLDANALALLLCTIINTTVHWELSHRMHQHSQKRRFVAVAAALFIVSLALTTAALGVVRVAAGPSLMFVLLAVTPAYAAAAVLRFSFLRAWVFRPAPVTIVQRSKALA
jgi:hypothetical protein